MRSENHSSPLRVMVVDDSAVIRGLISRTLETAPDLKVVCSAGNGAAALAALERNAPEVVILDIEMPVMDGLTALPRLLAADPQLRVIMVSTLTLRNAEISLRALALGAADYMAKPTSARTLMGAEAFQRELVEKVRALGAARRKRAPAPGTEGRAAGEVDKAAAALPSPPVALRARATGQPRIVAIGSSTGGPQALESLFRRLGSEVTCPIVLTQHMPSPFTTILATHMERASGRPCSEGTDGQPIEPGRIYVAPGGHHMLVALEDRRPVIRLSDGPPENYCKPAVDPMLRTVVEVYGGAVLAVILTGMGADGLKGCRDVVAAGGAVIGQDEETSVVWGMPGAVANAGLCSAVLPIDEIGRYVTRIAAGARR